MSAKDTPRKTGSLPNEVQHEHLSPEERTALRKAARASFIGNFVEWYDYISYSSLVVIIGRVFFPEADPRTQIMLTFTVFAISFFLRPIGGFVWGALGDKFGRRFALSWSILIMSGATFLIAFLPGYATLGVGAPLLLLLLRSIQGFSASGEYAGASAFLAEYAPVNKRGMYCSIVPASTAAGVLGASLFVTALFLASGGSLQSSDSAFMESWGWRIPFLIAGPLGLIGRYIRLHLEDSPVYRDMESRIDAGENTPLRTLFKDHWREILIAFGVSSLNAVGFYFVMTYLPTYMQTELKIDSDTVYIATTAALVVYMVAIFFSGHISDTFGRRKMLILASVLFMILSLPLVALMHLGHGIGISAILLPIIGYVIFALILTVNDGTLASFLSELFPTKVRYSGFAVSFNSANALLGGTAPAVCTWLIKVTGSDWAPGYYLMAIAGAALVAMLIAKETAFSKLKD